MASETRLAEPEQENSDSKRFRDRLDAALAAGDVEALDAYRLLRLSLFARPDGWLRNRRGLDYDEVHLARWLYFKSVKGFYKWWRRMHVKGWVTAKRPPNRGRLQRRLLAKRTGTRASQSVPVKGQVLGEYEQYRSEPDVEAAS